MDENKEIMAASGKWQIKSLKAKADRKRNWSEKITDRVVSFAGTFWFLALNFTWFVFWILANTGQIPAIGVFDPYPFVMLTTVVSLQAIVLSIFVLISQNRASKVADLREEVDLQLDVITEKEITKVLEIVNMMAAKQGIDLSKDEVLKEMLKEVDRGKIEHLLENQIDKS